MRTMKHWALAVAAASALALAGCGGGGSGATSMMEEMAPTPTPAEQIAELQGQINALRAELGLPAIDISELTGSVSTLQGQVSTLQGQIAARDREIAARDKEIADAAQKAMTAKGKVIFKVLDGPPGVTGTPAATVIAVPRADLQDTTPRLPNISATYGQATKLTTANQKAFVDSLAERLNGVAATETAFTSAQASAPVSLAANNGFSGTMLTWSSSTRADTMTVYTDIGAPRGVLFSEQYGNGGQVFEPADNTTHTGVTGTAFTGRTAGEVEHDANAKLTTASTTDDLVRLPGSYKGAAGTYTCTPAAATGDGCITRVTSSGVMFVDTDADTGWMFTANNGAMVSVADTSYMTFGWWMRDVKSTSDILDNVAVFYEAPHPDNLAVNALTGTAKYEGGAAGKYAWRDRVADTAHGGHFTAKAMLSANFGSATAGGRLSGSISDFRIGDDGTDPDWTVTLSAPAVAATSNIVDAGSVARGLGTVTWAVGSSKANAAGSWEAQFSNSGAKRNDNLPTGVAGAFNATFNEQGRMIGAFGANITNPNPPN